MEKKLFKIILVLSIICFIFTIYDALDSAKTFHQPFFYALLMDNSNFLLFSILIIASSLRKFWLILSSIVFFMIWSYFNDNPWLGYWAVVKVIQRIVHPYGQFSIFFSGIASLCFLAILILVLILLGIRIKNYYKKKTA